MNIKQQTIMKWLDGQSIDPPHYQNGGLAAAIARLRKNGYVVGMQLTPMGKLILQQCRPTPRRGVSITQAQNESGQPP